MFGELEQGADPPPQHHDPRPGWPGRAGVQPADEDDRAESPLLCARAGVFQKEYPKITPRRLGELFAELEYFVLFHEVGHALIDQWDLPVLGREEDAVDAFSTIVMTEIVDKGEFALAGADFFYYLAGTGHLKEVDFADEHSFDKQRAYSIACWVYGSDTKKFGYLRSVLPAERRVRCADEYRRLKKAWFGFLKPHVRG